jgi:hypothetical protein
MSLSALYSKQIALRRMLLYIFKLKIFFIYSIFNEDLEVFSWV